MKYTGKKSLHSIPLLLLAAAIQQANATAIANPDTATMIQGTGSIAIDVLANDTSDLEDGTVRINYFDSATASYGSVVFDEASNQLVYTPPSEDFVGTDSFFYYAVDDSGYGGSAMVTIEVSEAVEEPEEPEEPQEPEEPEEPEEPQEPEQPAVDFSLMVDGLRNSSVAGMLTNVCAASELSEQLSRNCGQLYAAAAEADLNPIMAQIAPDEALIQSRLLAENSRNKTSRIYQSMAQMRSGSGGALVGINNHLLPSGGAAGDGFDSPWTLLTSVQLESFERNQTWREAGYESEAVGVLLGLGYRVNGNLNLGAALDWTAYEVDFANDGGTLDSDVVSLTGFLSWYSGPLTFDLQLGYATGDTEAQRIIRFPDVSVANSDYGSDQFSASTQFEYGWQSGAWSLKPFVRLDYLNTQVDAFAETGDSPWLTSAEKQTHEQLNTSVGVDTSYTLAMDWGVLIPSLRFSAVNEAHLGNDDIAFNLIDAGSLGNFELRADTADSLFYQWDVSTVFVLPNGVSTFLSGRVVSSYANTSAYQITGGINWEF